MSHFEHKPFYIRNLPHVQPMGATFFVTFQLAGSLPRPVLRQYKYERDLLEKQQATSSHSEDEFTQPVPFHQKDKRLQWRQQWFRKFEEVLDTGRSGPLWLKDARVANMIAKSLHYRDGKVYRLDAYCIMANHVHVVFTPLAAESSGSDVVSSGGNQAQTHSLCYKSLSSLMQSLKGYTARKANYLLGLRGQFWQHESYDHVVRDSEEWGRIVTYVLNNPVKAGLVDTWEEWEWSYFRLEHHIL